MYRFLVSALQGVFVVNCLKLGGDGVSGIHSITLPRSKSGGRMSHPAQFVACVVEPGSQSGGRGKQLILLGFFYLGHNALIP